jgi:hypothetical protein
MKKFKLKKKYDENFSIHLFKIFLITNETDATRSIMKILFQKISHVQYLDIVLKDRFL